MNSQSYDGSTNTKINCQNKICPKSVWRLCMISTGFAPKTRRPKMHCNSLLKFWSANKLSKRNSVSQKDSKVCQAVRLEKIWIVVEFLFKLSFGHCGIPIHFIVYKTLLGAIIWYGKNKNNLPIRGIKGGKAIWNFHRVRSQGEKTENASQLFVLKHWCEKWFSRQSCISSSKLPWGSLIRFRGRAILTTSPLNIRSPKDKALKVQPCCLKNPRSSTRFRCKDDNIASGKNSAICPQFTFPLEFTRCGGSAKSGGQQIQCFVVAFIACFVSLVKRDFLKNRCTRWWHLRFLLVAKLGPGVALCTRLYTRGISVCSTLPGVAVTRPSPPGSCSYANRFCHKLNDGGYFLSGAHLDLIWSFLH